VSSWTGKLTKYHAELLFTLEKHAFQQI